jgi:hypothetical protein
MMKIKPMGWGELMKIPVIEGNIKRRILINYQVEPQLIAGCLPPMFKPKEVLGKAIIGVCLIRLENIHPKRLPKKIGVSSENAAHRIAVEWKDDAGKQREGVYIFRRDTNSRINHWLGGRLFPGEHHPAEFHVKDSKDKIQFQLMSNDLQVKIEFDAQPTDQLPSGSVFKSVDELSRFFQSGADGYSAVTGKNRYHGMCLIPHDWNMSPLDCGNVELSYFHTAFGIAKGDLSYDSMVIMRDIPHEWQSLKTMTC